MASQTKSSTSKSGAGDIFEFVLDAPRKAGKAHLDTTKWAADRVAELQRQAGDATSIDWIADIAGAQADVTRDVAQAYVSAGRKLVG
jgi:hypothetical protein